MDSTQLCARCTRDLPLEAFAPKRRGVKGTYCTECSNECVREWRATNVKPAPVRICAVSECQSRVRPKDRVHCGPHHRRYVQHGDPLGTAATTHPVSYTSLHARLRTVRGSATLHHCIRCRQQADQWAYNHDDVNEIVQQHNGRTVSYSLDLNRYDPMCRRCHANFDAGRS